MCSILTTSNRFLTMKTPGSGPVEKTADRGRERPPFRTRLDLAGLPLDVNHAGAWGSRLSRLDLDRDQPGLGQFPSVESAGSENALAALAGRPQLHVKTSVLVLCYSIFIAGHARYYGGSRSRAPVARCWLNDRCSVAGFLKCPGCPRRQSSAQRSLRGLDPKRLGGRELAVLLTAFEEGIDAHIPAQPMVERKNGLSSLNCFRVLAHHA